MIYKDLKDLKDTKFRVQTFDEDGKPAKSYEAYGRDIFHPLFKASGAAADELNTICNMLDECAMRMDKLSRSAQITRDVAAPLYTYARLLSNISLDFLSATS